MAKNKMADTPIRRVKAFRKDGETVNVVIETPKGNRNKYKYEPSSGFFELHTVLPAGAVFPFDFGFIPETVGQDGDPLDILVLMDEPAFTGCVAPVRLIGVIEAEQTEKDETIRNDRLIGVAIMSKDHEGLRSLKQVEESLVHEIEHFFESYDVMDGKKFKPIAQRGPSRAVELVKQGVQKQQKDNR